ncbi:phospholipid/cholesterol/gamma-HCH transport system substrate-binding protein [Nocardioides aromaticivorans]|uniref:Phospholipid/cholesterol/gamma-HCH transport system substrate-binding protein n=1 Tax=Nocardioides aromaticivorans TaxID=200618 RepID=A0A7Y9ZGV9_9ACTN|nr:MlaD family protein [Nocardioides aromaticivorans]NYI45202.1 phospholipid/cholesterol/gamma-HCH transport system substrate-binding protein [Nocardioides aromaticivorans]
MLLTPLIKRQLRIFAVLATLALGLAFIHYARVPAMLGVGVYDVTVDFEDASGLYPKAAVTYRGVNVGQVSDFDVTDSGAVATLRIDNGTDIPAGVSAELHSTSAIGEQYVDLVDPSGKDTGKDTSSGELLADGAAIPRERAVGMPQITPVLDSLNRLLESVPKKETKAVLDQVDEGLGGSGPELSELVDSSGRLLTEAQAEIDATTSLISALEPVLGTQADLAPETQGYADSLDKVTAALAKGDSADLRALLERAPGGLDAATATVTDLQPVLPMMLANLTTNAQVLNTYLPHVRQILVVYPSEVARALTVLQPRAGQGDVQLDLRGALNNPPSCQSGYLAPTQRRSPRVTTTRKVDRLAHCEAPVDSPVGVRGARNAPCPQSSARGPLPAACGLTFRGGVWPASSGTVAYDLAVGRGDDTAAKDVTTGRSAKADDLWKILVLAPLEAN